MPHPTRPFRARHVPAPGDEAVASKREVLCGYPENKQVGRRSQDGFHASAGRIIYEERFGHSQGSRVKESVSKRPGFGVADVDLFY
jgi:hypothetical protein